MVRELVIRFLAMSESAVLQKLDFTVYGHSHYFSSRHGHHRQHPNIDSITANNNRFTVSRCTQAVLMSFAGLIFSLYCFLVCLLTHILYSKAFLSLSGSCHFRLYAVLMI